MRVISILIKVNLFILTLLLLGLIYSFFSGVSILLPGLGLVISLSAIMFLLIIVNLLATLLLMLLQRLTGKPRLR